LNLGLLVHVRLDQFCFFPLSFAEVTTSSLRVESAVWEQFGVCRVFSDAEGFTPFRECVFFSMARRLPPGFRFHPTDQELVAFYLKRKVCGKRIEFDVVAEVDLYKCEPWDLPGRSWRTSESHSL
jgi:hypothetical protein